jgi:hypothetical protein
MATPPRVSPAEPSALLDAPNADDLEGLGEPFDIHALLEATSFELGDPELAGVPFN